jgi:hypothetical protein
VVDQYIFSGSLPENASTYVTREADAQLYEGLKAGKFCYVLNSRQSGKSSLRVRTMQRLREDDVQCAAVDLSAGGIQNVPPEQWYADLIDTLIDTFELDLDFSNWWKANQLNSLVTRFRKFLEEILLIEVRENIVIFIDEIDSVLSLNFPTDDFFALIRACYNKRVDNPAYNRLTFCLLGVASPSNLIEDKQRTPFNIGQAISLKGFQLHEVEPLEKGLYGKFSNPHTVIQEILQWTGGQPFLTQKLCQFMVEKSQQEHPRSVEQVVRSRIIENWESLDEPEHLRTIQARILRDEQRAGYLLELYQQIRLAQERSLFIIADETLEQSDLQLSGLVVRQEGKLRIYNQIYREIFDLNWIETQLDNLRPYAENFRAWMTSTGKDESRLLRGQALQDAKQWSLNKSLSYQDQQFLAASEGKEIREKNAAADKEAELERERQDKEAAEERNQLLSKANKKAQRQIGIGIVVLIVTVVGAAILGASAHKQVNETKEEVSAVQKLNKLAGELQGKENSYSKDIKFSSNEALRLSALSFNVNNHQLKQALVFAIRSKVYQQLKKLKESEQEIEQSKVLLKKAGEEIQQSKKFLDKADRKYLDSSQGLQIQVLFQEFQGDLLIQNKQIKKAIESYSKAFKILKTHPNETDFTKDSQLLTSENIEYFHRDLINLIAKNKTEVKLREQVKKSLTEHLYAELKYYLKAKNWRAADFKTFQLMYNIAKVEEGEYLGLSYINSFSCSDLQKIDQLWISNSDNRFGFSVQKEIWINTKNRLGIKPEDWTYKDTKNYRRFVKTVGWYDENGTFDNQARDHREYWVYGSELIERIEGKNSGIRGSLPSGIGTYRRVIVYPDKWGVEAEIESGFLALRLVKCNL